MRATCPTNSSRSAVGVCGEIKIAHVTALGQVASGVAVVEQFARRGGLKPASGSLAIGVADKEDAMRRLLTMRHRS